MQLPRLLGISGSLRHASFSTALLESLVPAVENTGQLTVFKLTDVPLYNQDVDTSTPPPGVLALRAAIAAADGVILASPEYNYGMSGVLKNALDWASRPYGHSALIGKPVVIFTSSPGHTGGVRAHAQLNETLIAIGARMVLRPQLAIGSVREKFKDGRLTDAATLGYLVSGVANLLTEIARPQSHPTQEF